MNKQKMNKQLNNSYTNPLPSRETNKPDRAESAKISDIKQITTMAA